MEQGWPIHSFITWLYFLFEDKQSCVFSSVEVEEKENKKGEDGKPVPAIQDNHWDTKEGYTLQTKEQIIAKIKELLADCNTYNVFKRNCEHTATYIRYNRAVCNQVRFFVIPTFEY